jgi:hypothetical protein
MGVNTEPIFICKPFVLLTRLQTGSVVLPTVSANLTSPGTTLVDCDAESQGALIVDIWCLPLAPIGAGNILRFFITEFDSGQVNMLFETTISAANSPLARQELGVLLPEVLSPAQTGLAGKKRALYIGTNTKLTVGLSSDLPVPIVVGCQGGYY